MNFINHKKYHLIAILLTFSLLLSSCITSRGPVNQAADTSTDSSQEYEQYQENTLKAQSDFDALTDKIFKESITDALSLHYTLQDPAAYGITDVPLTFGNYSVDEMKKNLEENKGLYIQFDGFDVSQLRKDQQLTCKIVKSILHADLNSEGMELYDLPFTTTIGVQAQLPILLAEYTFHTKKDVEDYLALLSTIDTYYVQIMDYMKAKADAGLMLTDFSIDRVIESCEGYLIPASHNIMNTTFVERINELPDITEEEKQNYINQNMQIIEEHFLPAYQAVKEGMAALKGTGTNEGGLCNFPDGKKYYKYLVESNIHPSYSNIEALKNAIEERMDQDLYAQTTLLHEKPEILNEVDTYQFSHTEPEDILVSLQEQIKAFYPELPECTYTLKHVPAVLQNSLSPAFYLTPPMDQPEDNVIYINDKFADTDIYTTLAHEGYPGHLYQNVYFANADVCNLRHVLSFPSYAEGWGTYAEIHSYMFDNGLSDDLAKVLAYNTSYSYGLYALMDINIHYFGWTVEQFGDYLNKTYGITDDEVVKNSYYSIVETPGNYLTYYTGYLEFSDMANIASKKKGNTFDLKEFNTFLLDIGPAPFSVIREEFEYWLLQ